jgi:exosortase/archaeosortase family protein
VWQGEALQFDAPCSGVNMLWASLMLTLAACTVWRSGAIMTAAALAAAIVLAVAANVLRAASLFFVETGLIADAPAWWHEAIGIAAFAGSAIASLRVMKRLQQCGLGRQRISPSPAPLVRASGGRLPLTLSWGLLGSAALAAALMPLVAHAPGRAAAVAGFPGWPGEHEGRTLTPLPLTDREAAFVRDFPGRIARFSDGSREIILRWVAEPTRRLHPASDCFRGSGYAITPLPLRRDVSGAAMGCFRATRGGEVMTVCEQIRDGAGTRWSDASSWYWEAMLGRSQGPWWSVVVGAAGGEMPAATASPPRTGSDRGTRAP